MALLKLSSVALDNSEGKFGGLAGVIKFDELIGDIIAWLDLNQNKISTYYKYLLILSAWNSKYMRKFLDETFSLEEVWMARFKTKLIFAFFLGCLFFAGDPLGMAWEGWEVERVDVSWSEPLPTGFEKRVAHAEEKYSGPWREFDVENLDLEIYYGLIRGHAIGEFKIALDKKGKTMNGIFLLAYGRDQYALSLPKAVRFETSQAGWEFGLKDRGQGYHGKSGTLVRGSVYGEDRDLLKGTYTLSLGVHGLISGKFFGIRMISSQSPVSSYQSPVTSLAPGNWRLITGPYTEPGLAVLSFLSIL